jgi:hypothetical protein
MKECPAAAGESKGGAHPAGAGGGGGEGGEGGSDGTVMALAAVEALLGCLFLLHDVSCSKRRLHDVRAMWHSQQVRSRLSDGSLAALWRLSGGSLAAL